MSYEVPTSTKQNGNFEVVHIPGDQYYEVELVEVKDAKKEGKFGAKTIFLFNVVSHNKKLAVSAYKRPATPTNMMGTVFQALGIPINDQTVDVTKYYGKRCKALIEDYKETKKNEQTGKDEVVIKSVIAKLKPLVETQKVTA